MSVGKFVVTKGKHWSGLTLKNHIGAIFGSKPQLASNVTTVLLQKAGMKNLDTTLSMFKEKTLESSEDFMWHLVGSSERNIPLVEARYNGAVVTDIDEGIGAGRTTFELVFSEKWFTRVHVIAGHRPDEYQMRILNDPRPEGGNYVYTCEVWGGQESLAGIPGDEFSIGNRFSIESSYVEDELSTRGSGIGFTTPYTMRNSVSTLRFEHKVSGAMLDCKIKPVTYAKFETLDEATGKVRKSATWMQEVMFQFEKTVSKLKSRTIMFGKTNRAENGKFLNKGDSSIEIKAGSGIREQIEVSNTNDYNRFSLRLLEDTLFELSEGKLEFSERKFMLRTGERGAVQFHRAVSADATGWKNITQNNPAVLQKANSKLHPNAMKLGVQFTEYVAPNNIHVMLEVDPMYDDKIRNKVSHPDGGVAESYRYDILYIGSMDEPNIQKIKVRGQEEIRAYKGGLRNPFTGQRGGNISHLEDSAIITAMCTTGAMVKDPSRTATLKPSIIA